MDIVLWLELVAFVVLMGLSAFFSSSETSLFSLDRLQLEQMRQDKNPRIDLIKRLLAQPRRLIVTILIGNELVNVAASVISAAVVIDLLGAENKWVNLFVMVPVLLLFGEITPKTLAIRNNIGFASRQARLVEGFAVLIKPLRWVVRKIADYFTTLVVGRERTPANIITEDMVRSLTRQAVGEGTLEDSEAEYIDQIFDFGDKTLRDVMTPRSQVFSLAATMSLEEMAGEIHRTRHTKVPIYGEDRETVIGILFARDLLGVDTRKRAPASGGETPARFLRKFLRKAYFVPESRPAADLFHTFRKRKLSLALTVDEYGGVTGLVTMEDLLECIFGEIYSPSDEFNKPGIEKLDDNRFRVDGSLAVSDFNAAMESRLSEEFGRTLGGIILHSFGEIPGEGSLIDLDNFRFTVTEVEANRIKTLECEPIEKVSESPEAGDETKPENGPDDSGHGAESIKED